MKEKARHTLTFCKCERLILEDYLLSLFICLDCKNRYIRVYYDPDIFFLINKGQKNDLHVETVDSGRRRWKTRS